ncbi:MAG: ribosomal-processing cysteine protease Prp [Bacilli bacterium]|nr:ribosomal-processing cysteine protease Prp [Bacilli bacterium]
MIKVLKEMDKIIISGHANYADSNDIVCASVSSIMYTTVNAILNINEEAITFEDDNNKCTITIKSHDDITDKLIDNMMLLLTELKDKYPSNIEIK